MRTATARIDRVPHKPDCQCPPCRYRRGDQKRLSDQLTLRMRLDLAEWVRSRPEGMRPYLERLVEEDRKRHESDKGPTP